MLSWLHSMLRLFRSYFIVEVLFGLWGLASAYATYRFNLNWNLMLVVAVVGGFFTALPLWPYLTFARPSERIPQQSTLTSNSAVESISSSWLAQKLTTTDLDLDLLEAGGSPVENIFVPINAFN